MALNDEMKTEWENLTTQVKEMGDSVEQMEGPVRNQLNNTMDRIRESVEKMKAMMEDEVKGL